jgi:hypothetical protein
MKLVIFSIGFRKKIQIKSFTIFRPVGAELFHADGQTDGQDEANRRFSQICEMRQKFVSIANIS